MANRSSHKFTRWTALILIPLGIASFSACASSPSNSSPFPISNLHSLKVNTTKADRLGNSDSVNPRDGAPYRTYEVYLVEGDILRIVAESSDFTPGISLFGPDGTLIGSTENRSQNTLQSPPAADPYGYGAMGGFPQEYGAYGQSGIYGEYGYAEAPVSQQDSTNGRKSIIRRASQEGRYLIVVSSLNLGEQGSFQVRTESIEPPTAFAFPGETTDFLHEGGRIHPRTRSLLNVHPLQLDEDTAVDIKLHSLDFTPQLSIVEAGTERVLAQSQPQLASNESSLLTELPAGSYEIWVNAYYSGPDGRYTLNAQPGEIQRSGPFELGQTFRSFLGWNRAAIPSSSRQGEAMHFELDDSAILDALMHTTDFSSYLILTDEEGNVLREDQESGWTYNAQQHWQTPPAYDARIYWRLEPGNYTLWATSTMPDESGAYRVTNTLHDAPSEDTFFVGESITGALTQSSEIHPRRYTPVEYMTLEVQEAGEIRIDLANSEFDAFLVLEDEWGQSVVEMEYDFYTDSRPQIVHHLAPGTYRIGITSVVPNALGSFTLRVRPTGPSGQHG